MKERKISASLLLTFLLFAPIAAGSADRPRPEGSNENYRSSDCSFNYPANFKVSKESRGATIRIAAPSRSLYWDDTIIIRRHNKKTEECDIPQSSTPNVGGRRNIAGRRAVAYSGEDVAMNRLVNIKGYIIETATSCWRFELVRNGRPYQKLDLSSEEVKRLDKQSNQDSEKANVAFDMVLDSFAFRRK